MEYTSIRLLSIICLQIPLLTNTTSVYTFYVLNKTTQNVYVAKTTITPNEFVETKHKGNTLVTSLPVAIGWNSIRVNIHPAPQDEALIIIDEKKDGTLSAEVINKS